MMSDSLKSLRKKLDEKLAENAAAKPVDNDSATSAPGLSP